MRVFVALLLLASTPVVRAAEPPRSSTALQIFDAALEKFEANRTALRSWQYHQTLTTHQLDSHGKVVASGTWKSIVRPGDPRPLEYISSKTEGTISFFKKDAPVPSHPNESPAPAATSSGKAEKNQAEAAVEAIQKYKLRERYDWVRLDDETIHGESAYVLSFSPKPNQKTRSREERFFSLLAGRMWIAKSDNSVLQAEASLQSPCPLFWIIARVTTFKFTYELGAAPGGNRLFRPSKATATTVVSFPFISIRQKHWHTTDGYEPRTPRRLTAR